MILFGLTTGFHRTFIICPRHEQLQFVCYLNCAGFLIPWRTLNNSFTKLRDIRWQVWYMTYECATPLSASGVHNASSCMQFPSWVPIVYTTTRTICYDILHAVIMINLRNCHLHLNDISYRWGNNCNAALTIMLVIIFCLVMRKILVLELAIQKNLKCIHFITHIVFAQKHIAQCSMPNFKPNGKSKWMSWTNKVCKIWVWYKL